MEIYSSPSKNFKEHDVCHLNKSLSDRLTNGGHRLLYVPQDDYKLMISFYRNSLEIFTIDNWFFNFDSGFNNTIHEYYLTPGVR
jgi:hypothetical protein